MRTCYCCYYPVINRTCWPAVKPPHKPTDRCLQTHVLLCMQHEYKQKMNVGEVRMSFYQQGNVCMLKWFTTARLVLMSHQTRYGSLKIKGKKRPALSSVNYGVWRLAHRSFCWGGRHYQPEFFLCWTLLSPPRAFCWHIYDVIHSNPATLQVLCSQILDCVFGLRTYIQCLFHVLVCVSLVFIRVVGCGDVLPISVVV